MALEDMHGLSGDNRFFEDDNDLVKCKECCGTGKDLSSLDKPCTECSGTGRVTRRVRKWQDERGF